MSDTQFINLSGDSWRNVTNIIGQQRGFMSNISNRRVVYVIAGSPPPDASIRGHHLQATPGVLFNIEQGFNLFVRSIQGKSVIAVTPGVNINA